MHKFAPLSVMLLILGSMVTPTTAAPMLVLSSPSNLSNLSVGDRVRINVSLQDLDVGNDFVFVLNSRLSFPGSLLEPVPDSSFSSGLTPGEILVTAAQRNSFNAVSSLTDGVVTGNFSDSSPTPSQAISQNGVFFSFLLAAQSVGSGTIRFDSASIASNSTGFNLAPLPTGGPLAFAINAAPLPEPSSLALSVIGTTLGLVGYGCRRRNGPTASE